MEQPDAAILTAIGISAAFGVLVLLLASALLIRLAGWAVAKLRDGGANDDEGGGDDAADGDRANRARAAAIAVVALMEAHPRGDGQA